MACDWLSTDPRLVPWGRVARGRLRLPSSKSVTHRVLSLALLGGRPCVVHHPLESQDIDHFLEVLRRLGWEVAAGPDRIRIEPPAAAPSSAQLDCGNAGTLGRFLVGVLTTLPGTWRLDGTSRMRERPIGPLVSALRGWGAEIAYLGTEGRLPVEIRGGTLAGGSTTLDAGESSQYLSALLLAGTRAASRGSVRVTALTSSPYVDITRRLIDAWGGRVEVGEEGMAVHPGLEPLAEATVEGDHSAAPYPAVAAILTGGRVTLSGLDPDSAQGDRQFLEVLANMGARVEWRPFEVEVSHPAGQPLQALDIDLSGMPDQVPTLAALAPFATGTTRIRNVAHLRIKESDRLAAMATELGRVGAAVSERPDGLEIEGIWAATTPPADPVTVATYDDHRIAMCMALVGLRRPGISIADPGTVGKSYPGFWHDLHRLLEP